MPRVKERFQAALQHTPSLRQLFNLQLDDKIQALDDIAQHAESEFWAMGAAQFEREGMLIHHTARAAADALCASAEELVNQIIARFHTVCSASSTAATVDWTEAAYMRKSLYAPYVSEFCATALDKTLFMRTALANCHDVDTYEKLKDSFQEIYDWVLAELQAFGPNFPTPLTAFYSTTSSVTNRDMQIGVSLDADGRLQLYNRPRATLADFQGAASGFHHLGVDSTGGQGDQILLVRLEADDSRFDEFAPYVGRRRLTIMNDGEATPGPLLNPLTLRLDSENLGHMSEALPGEIIYSDYLTEFGECFEIRKIRGYTPS